MEFHTYLKSLRLKHFSDTNKISKLLKIPRNMWRKIEKGINPPPRKSLLIEFCRFVYCKDYEKNQLFTLARRWQPSPHTNTVNEILSPSIELMKKMKPEEYRKWHSAAIEANTPDYPHKYWGAKGR